MPARNGEHPVRASLDVANEPGAIERAADGLANALERHGYPKASLFAVRLALHEAMSNAFHHGHKALPAATPVRVEYEVTHDTATIQVADRGPGFDPSGVPDPTLDENIERGSGRGLLLIRSFMASAEFNRAGNELRMVYRRPPDA